MNVAGKISFSDVTMKVQQSEGELVCKVLRSIENEAKGRVVVPWSIQGGGPLYEVCSWSILKRHFRKFLE